MTNLELNNSIKEQHSNNDSIIAELEETKREHERNRDYEKAFAVCKQICDLLSDTKGPDDIETLNYMVKLSFCYAEANHKDKARALMSEVYRRKCELFGENAPTTVRTQCANLLLYDCDDENASDLESAAGEKIELIYNIDDIDVMHAMYNYAFFLESYYGQTVLTPYLDILNWVLKFKGKGSSEHLSILSELADIYYVAELYEEAIEVGEEYYSYSCSKYGAEDNHTLLVDENLAKVYFFNENYKEAMRRLEKLSEIYERNGVEARRIIGVYCNLAICNYRNNNVDQARQMIKKAYDLCRNSDAELGMLANDTLELHTKLNDAKKHTFVFLRWRDVYGMFI
ncbi:MAG: tetratricopeptide repeat protein [Clostridia bacterium]|nr:tetratricopeptide repeat protein [Clostridia bacterium]